MSGVALLGSACQVGQVQGYRLAQAPIGGHRCRFGGGLGLGLDSGRMVTAEVVAGGSAGTRDPGLKGALSLLGLLGAADALRGVFLQC